MGPAFDPNWFHSLTLEFHEQPEKMSARDPSRCSSRVLLISWLIVTGFVFGIGWVKRVAFAGDTAAVVLFATDSHGREKRLPDEIRFNAHIRPIMSNTCFACHGPDEEENHSDLRLDSFEHAVDDGGAIEPGAADASLIYQRMTDEADPMPPADFRHQLSDYEKALFKKWIEQGAEYQQHWSYSPIVRPEVPTTAFDDRFVANPIDSFIADRLEFEGLEPSPRADKATLLRRLSLDLIGLPPTPDQLKRFLADDSPDAYRKQVERLLASPHFGERMASQWLDIVRFSDTVGFHGDQNHRIFPYRDYVINSLNSNKPFDEFTREQLAGDLLENPTEEQLVATGLVRLNMVTREGGAQSKEYLAKYAADRVRMLGTAWLGATTGCCECHNHKYDPFTIEDFYALGAFFDDIRQWGIYTSYGFTPNKDLQGFTNQSPFPPEMRFRSDSLMAQLAYLESQLTHAAAEKVSEDVFQSAEFRDWFKQVAAAVEQNDDGWLPVHIVSVDSLKETPHEILNEGSVLFRGEAKPSDVVSVLAAIPEPLRFRAVRMEMLPDPANQNRVGRARDGRFGVSLEVSVQDVKPKPLKPVEVKPRYVRIETDSPKPLSLGEVQVFARPFNEQKNIAANGKVTQSSMAWQGEAKLAVDEKSENNFGKSASRTKGSGAHWWELDLGSERDLAKVIVWGPAEKGNATPLKDCNVLLLNDKRQRIWSHHLKATTPSAEVTVSAEAVPEYTGEPVKIAFGQADRFKPAQYNSGRPGRFLEKRWQSGPIPWQLPRNETELKHTATFQLQRPTSIGSDELLNFRLNSKDIGRVRISVSPLVRFVAGLPAASSLLRSAIESHSNANPLTNEQRDALLSAWYLAVTPTDKLPGDIKVYRDQIADCRSGMAMTLVTQQAEPEKRAHTSRVLPRGDWQDESMPPIRPATPGFLPGLPDAEGRTLNRLDLANWLTSDDNPLTARHYVNRLWKHFFGAGFSNQLDDLGNQGEWPSHPQLLDWMASEFRATWDVKRMIRLIVMSNTYQQQASVRSDLSEADPYNRLLSQQSARRLEAEAVRDNALAISGLLFKDYIGGPSVFPYQPDGHYDNIQFPNRSYTANAGAFQYRRGVYQHWQRTFLHPMLVNFDAPSRDECMAARNQSNSPQQALTLLNDPQFVEASNAFAHRLMTESPAADFSSRLNAAFRQAVARDASDLEQETLKAFFDKQLNHYRTNPKEVDELLFKNGLFKPANKQNLDELAAWSQVCRVILNLHETITRL